MFTRTWTIEELRGKGQWVLLYMRQHTTWKLTTFYSTYDLYNWYCFIEFKLKENRGFYNFLISPNNLKMLIVTRNFVRSSLILSTCNRRDWTRWPICITQSYLVGSCKCSPNVNFWLQFIIYIYDIVYFNYTGHCKSFRTWDISKYIFSIFLDFNTHTRRTWSYNTLYQHHDRVFCSSGIWPCMLTPRSDRCCT